MVSVKAFPFSQVDVFAEAPGIGNPVAVVHDADELTTQQMQAFANWTNLSETTFLLRPTIDEADYRLRIFTPHSELPFAGHPTLGSAHAWLQNLSETPDRSGIVQECGAGLVEIRRTGDGELAFAAPELRRSGPVDAPVLDQAITSLGVDRARVLGANWIVNGPQWLGVRLDSADTVLSLRPDFAAMGQLEVAVIGAYPPGGPVDFEVRAFAPGDGVPEDPVTGSANAGLAQWLIGEGLVPAAGYRAQQGTVLGRRGSIGISSDDAGVVWVSGSARTVVKGYVRP